MKKLFLFVALLTALAVSGAGYIRIEFDGRKTQTSFKDVEVSQDLKKTFTHWIAEKDRSAFLMIEGSKPLDEKWKKFEFSFVPERSGLVRFFLRGNWTKKTHLQWVEYDHIDMTGANILNPSFETVTNGAYSAWRLRKANMVSGDAAVGRNFVRCAHDFFISQDISVTAGKRVTVKFFARTGKIEQPRPEATPFIWEQVTAQNRYATNFPPEYYRYYDARVKLLPLKNKGIRPDALFFEPDTIDTPMPEAQFKVPAAVKEMPAISMEVPVELLEESGVARTAQVRFGFPLPSGALKDLKSIEVLAPDRRPAAAQFSALGFWRDKSVKWVLIQFNAPLKAHEKVFYTVRFGKNITPSALSPLKFTETASEIKVETGRMSAVIDKNKFAFLRDVTVDGKLIGSFSPLVVRSEDGTVLPSNMLKPEKVRVLENGSERISFKVTGKYGKSASDSPGTYSAVIGFARGSAVADIAVTHINTNLNNEFTDITSLGMTFKMADAPERLEMDKNGVGKNQGFFQRDDLSFEAAGAVNKGRLSGSGTVYSKSGTLTFVLRDAALRWPKAFNIKDKEIAFDLLPELPDARFATHLPHYLQFPFCEGKYRLKWGMSFTERMKFDFSGKVSAAELGALDIVPVIDRDYLANCGALTGIPEKKITAFDPWDKALTRGFYDYMVMKAKQREYGFLNYGDWFGERSRNWANNEYDPAHSLFMLFCRTGNRDLFRWALTAARHQADVDIIHAYPDKFYIGANAQHGVGHTGVSHQRFIKPATWSYPVDVTFSGINGHVWSNGMVDAWCFTGDSQVMDSALKLGEHLTRYTAPRFKKLGTHERSGGWSMRALIAFYNALGEQKYLDGAARIAKIAMSEQKFDRGGAWPHKLPRDHSGGVKNANGNSCFLIGILTCALREYYLCTGDPAAKKSLIAAAQWQKRNFNPETLGFPYTASWDNKPYFVSSFAINCLIVPGMLYGGFLGGDKEIYEIAKITTAVETVRGTGPVGKELAMSLVFASEMIDGILRFHKAYPDLALPEIDTTETIGRFKNAKFNLRGPDRKEFRITLKKSSADITLIRQKTGARPQAKKYWDLSVTDADGKTVAEKKGVVAENFYKETLKISGKAGDVFTLIINDDMGGHWNIPPGADHYTELKAVPNTSFCNSAPGIFYFDVPAGTEEFSFRVTGVHPGGFSAWAIAPDGRIVAEVSGVNDIGPRFPWTDTKGDPSKTLTVKPGKYAAAKGKWKLLMIAGGDIQLEIRGIPPWLSITRD